MKARAVAACLLVAAISCLSLLGGAGVSASERAAIYGGQTTQKCIQTNLTCPDPGGMPSICTQITGTQVCTKCQPNVPNWKSCGTTSMSGTYSCTQTYAAGGPYCASGYYGNLTPSGDCVAACNMLMGPCGQQIPTTQGDNCP
jgi:hypothetical protein